MLEPGDGIRRDPPVPWERPLTLQPPNRGPRESRSFANGGKTEHLERQVL